MSTDRGVVDVLKTAVLALKHGGELGTIWNSHDPLLIKLNVKVDDWPGCKVGLTITGGVPEVLIVTFTGIFVLLLIVTV